MEDADEILFLEDYNDAQEVMVTQQDGRCSSSGQCGTAANDLNAILFPNERLSVPETTASHEKILKIPERENSVDRLNIERASCGRILKAPDTESHGFVSTDESILSPPGCRHDDSEVESDGSGSSLFGGQGTFTPTRTARRRSQVTLPLKASSTELHKDSSDSSSEPVPRFNLHQIFQRRRRRRYRRQGKLEAKKTCRKPLKPTLQPGVSIPLAKQKRCWADEISKFPFLDKKDLTFKMIFTYERASLWGFLHHMKKLKYERHLQTSLKNFNISNESEDGHVDGRGYSYLDDDGPISPISELNEDQCCGDADAAEKYDAKIVDNSCFILNWNPPAEKKQSKKKKKKRHGPVELDQEIAAVAESSD